MRFPQDVVRPALVQIQGSIVTMLTSSHRASEATTNGRFVGWQKAPSRFTSGAIALLNLQTGHRTQISVRDSRSMRLPAGDGRPWTICDEVPRMSGDTISWITDFGLRYANRQTLSAPPIGEGKCRRAPVSGLWQPRAVA